MAQNGNIICVQWIDTRVAPGTVLTGLSATINIRDMSGNLVVNNEVMTELGGGWYKYVFNGYDPAKDYVYDCNPNDDRAFIESGVTNNLQQLISEVRSGGGASINIQGIQTTIRNARDSIEKKVEEEAKKTLQSIQESYNETNSQIVLAKEEINDTINSIELDTSTIETGISSLKKRFTKLSEYVKKGEEEKMNLMSKEHEAKMNLMSKEHEAKMKEMEKKIDEIEDAYEEMEKLSKEEKDKILNNADELVRYLTEYNEKDDGESGTTTKEI